MPKRSFLSRCSRSTLAIPVLALLTTCSGGKIDQGDEDDDEATVKTASGTCGVERWSVKTGTDPDVGKVHLTPQDDTIAALGAVPAPAMIPANNRVAPTELQAVRLTNVTLTEYKLESDSDYHLVVTDGSHQMIHRDPDAGLRGLGQPLFGRDYRLARGV